MSVRRILSFERPYCIRINAEPLTPPGQGEVQVATLVSAISAGTELLVFRGQIPEEMTLDAVFSGLDRPAQYPVAYGYSSVGRVVDRGDGVDPQWLGRLVFVFRPHASHHVVPVNDLIPVPEGIDPARAALLPNMETAVNLALDAQPILGERVLIFGSGVVGLLLLSVLARFHLDKLAVVDGYERRRALALAWGANTAIPPERSADLDDFDPDLIIEVSGNPAALDTAIRVARFGTRVVVGSWYGSKPATLQLGGMYHRNRIRILSSQVSTISGALSERWTKARRIALAWDLLRAVPAEDLITHCASLEDAPGVYALLDKHPEVALQAILTY
jgi:2-desacetyl-2-hydroxyethyl bacteriochlorophyllide A dehydrogenase